MAEISSELIKAYESTCFRARTPEPVVIRVGQLSEPLDRMLSTVGVNTWAFITASNPQSCRLSDEDNAVRNNQLLADVGAYQPHVYSGEGVPDDPAWSPEASLLILGVDRDAALELGVKYGQNAIVFGVTAQPAELLLCVS